MVEVGEKVYYLNHDNEDDNDLILELIVEMVYKGGAVRATCTDKSYWLDSVDGLIVKDVDEEINEDYSKLFLTKEDAMKQHYNDTIIWTEHLMAQSKDVLISNLYASWLHSEGRYDFQRKAMKEKIEKEFGIKID